MSIVINGSGTITGLSAGGLPDATITQAELATGVAGTGPAFSAYQSSAQTLSSNTATKIQLQSEDFDTASAFNNTGSSVSGVPAYAFLPTVAGYYQINACLAASSSYCTGVCTIYKNGSSYINGPQNAGSPSGTANQWGVNALVYLNGSTDYVEIYGTLSIGQALGASRVATYFQAFMARSA